MPILAQKRLGEFINFKKLNLDEAYNLLIEREEIIKSFKIYLNKAKKFYMLIKNKDYNLFIEEIKNNKKNFN